MTETNVQETLQRELQRSEPDYVCFVPKHWDGSTHDALNEHFLVFEGPDGSMMAMWTQSSHRGDTCKPPRQVNRIVFARSEDDGRTWSAPVHIAGPKGHDEPPYMACWGFPLVSKSGRIYAIWNQNQGVSGWTNMHTGTMSGCYSDDNGATWSEPQDIPMPASPYDDPEGKVPGEWIVWQLPHRDLAGRWFAAYSRWPHPKRSRGRGPNGLPNKDCMIECMRFENTDDDPEPRDLEITWHTWGRQALRVPSYRDPLMSNCQEPSVVRLPDDRLFMTMRTHTGYIWYSVSGDDGETWCDPRPLLRHDRGEPILEPICCCPIYQLADGRYVLLHHNNMGDRNMRGTLEASSGPRRPAFLALGEFRPDADQPLWFSRSKRFMDNRNTRVDGECADYVDKAIVDIGVYPSFTTRNGENILWHPERKFFLVGKRLSNEFLAELEVPRTLDDI